MRRHAGWIGLCLGALASPAVSQTWVRQAPSPTAQELRGVSMVSDQEAWAIGDAGVLVHTTDAGRNWSKTDLPTDSMWKVTFVDPLYGWAVGNAVFRTTNGGQRWIPVTGMRHGTLDQVFFLDRMHGWTTDYNGIWRTTDGGISWVLHARNTVGDAGGIFFHDALRGWVASYTGEVEQTFDGGQTWTVVHTEPNMSLYRIWFVDDLEGWIVGATRVLHTSDGGASWQRRAFPASEQAASAAFVAPEKPGDDPVCYTAGLGGSIVKSTDGWLSYTVVRSIGEEPALYDISFVDADHGFAVGELGRLLYTWDGGQTWVDRQSGGPGGLYRMDANDVAHVWAAADQGRVLFTADGGNRWRQVQVDGFSTFGSIHDVDFLDDNVNGWATGLERVWVGDSSRVSRSTDGGRTWQLKYTSPTDFYFDTVDALDELTAVATGNSPFNGDLVLRTEDGGETWQDVTPAGPVGALLCSDFVNAKVGYIAGGRIWKTTDGGLNWNEQPNPEDVIEGISFANRKNGWGVGGYGYIIHTTDGGRHWEQQAVGQYPRYRMYDVSAVSPTEAWMVGGEYFSPFRRLVARTTDGGATWTDEHVPGVTDDTTMGLRAIAFVDADYGWLGVNVPTGSFVPDGGIWQRSNGPPLGLALQHDRLLMGDPTQFRVTGATPGEFALFFASPTGIAGSDPGLHLLPPVYFLTFLAVDATGAAVLNASLPPDLPPVDLHFQALVLGLTGVSETNTTSAPIER